MQRLRSIQCRQARARRDRRGQARRNKTGRTGQDRTRRVNWAGHDDGRCAAALSVTSPSQAPSPAIHPVSAALHGPGPGLAEGAVPRITPLPPPPYTPPSSMSVCYTTLARSIRCCSAPPAARVAFALRCAAFALRSLLNLCLLLTAHCSLRPLPLARPAQAAGTSHPSPAPNTLACCCCAITSGTTEPLRPRAVAATIN